MKYWYSKLVKLPVSSRLALGRALTLSVEFALIIYLMKLLGPEPFGLMAMVMAVLALAVALQDGGASASLVSDPDYSEKRVGAALVIGAGTGIILYVLCLAFMPLISWWYNDARITTVWLVVSTSVLISGVSSVPLAVAQREQRFDLMTWLPLSAVIVTALIILGMSQTRQDIWLLVANTLTSAFLSAFLLWFFIRPRIARPAKEDLMHVFHFSKGVIFSSFLGAMQRHADDIIVGKMLGASATGLYNFSYRMLQVPLREFGGIIDKLAYPRLSSLNQNKSSVESGVGQIVFEVTLMCSPLCVGVAVYSPDLIHWIFGNEWMGAVIPFQVFALLAIYQVPSARLGLVFLVMRQTNMMAQWALISTPFIVGSFFLGVQWGIEGVALCYASASLILGFWRVRWVASIIDARMYFFWGNWLRAVALGVVMFLIPYALDKLLLYTDLATGIRLICVSTVFAALFAGTYASLILRRRKVKPLW